MGVAEFMERLERHFGSDGVVGPRLGPICEAEEKHGPFVEGYVRGYRWLMESFHDFYVETLDHAARNAFDGQLSATDQTYVWLYLSHVTNFRSLRAAENLLLCGYPFDGYALLRDLKDRALFLGAVIAGLTTLHALNGFGTPDLPAADWTWESYRKLCKRRELEEIRVKLLMIGKKSGMTGDDIAQLKKWSEMFHEEVHGSRFTFFGEMETLLTKREVPMPYPIPSKEAIGMYTNRSSEICWLILRTLPFLQLSPKTFGEEWAEKWQVLDDSFRQIVEGLRELDQKSAAAFIAFVDAKFSLSPDTAYVERR